MPNHLTFVIHSANEFSSIDLLHKSLEDIKRLLSNVDYAIYGRKHQDEWIVQRIHTSAPTITLTPKGEDKQAVGIIGDGLRMVTEGTDQPPQYFTEAVFEGLKKMRRLFHKRNGGRSLLVLMDGEETATIGKDIAKQVSRILSSGHHNLGSLQGKLEAINVHKSHIATIWDRVSGAPVRWSFTPDETDHVKGLLEKLVLVTGDIHYFSNGAPRSISNVTAIQDATAGQHTVTAAFGSIPDKRLLEIGAAEWLKGIRGAAQE